MVKKLTEGFWSAVARLILRNRILILLLLVAATVFFGLQWKNMRFSNTEANVLPDDHPQTVQYAEFVSKFGQEDNAIVLAVRDTALFNPNNFNRWNKLSKQFQAIPEVTSVISTENLQELVKDLKSNEFKLQPLYTNTPRTYQEVAAIKDKLFEQLPFYENLLFNKKTGTVRTVIYIDKDLLNTNVRNEFILTDLENLVDNFERETGLDVRVSGMPYIKTWNSKIIIDEIGKFILAALAVTSLIFFFFFRSFRATLIAMSVVVVGVMWAFGVLGLFQYEITILTALIPPLIIVIGIPNCIFLINKYQQEVKKHGNQAKSLQRVIIKIGNATLMTNITTALGFATFIILDSDLLKEFGIVASINIISIFLLSLLIIPIVYSFMPIPKEKHLKHLNKKWVDRFVGWMENVVRNHRIAVYLTAVTVLVLSIIGIYQIQITGSRIEDLPKDAKFFKDIRFFEEEFNGVMPVELVVDTKRKNGVLKLATLRRMDRISQEIDHIPELSTPVSVVNLAKYSKQAFYNGMPKYYQLPTSQENTFILDMASKSKGNANLLESFVDSTGQVARMTTFMRDVKTPRMEEIENDLLKSIEKIFPKERYNVYITGKAILFLKGTKYLIKNLILSLALAIGLIAIFMAYLFRSFRMILISLVPNILPLVITAGLMGYLGIPIKPSTILIFSIAFGISVDDTIHFLAKYRQELAANKWQIKKSVYNSLRETGVSMFYTSIVLFFGFSVFIISSFGGTQAMGGLVSATLLFAMLSNLILLPSLLLSLERNIANKKIFKKPQIRVLPLPDEENDKP
ncbi:transporter [Croceivirga radicis]|uniref:Transporter n=1 Tax=Croceivirga radicis TaxID=1929488 RepID=A0A1V6LU51_9FLAO|nr:efflux RND transporter permease subunit [Croceivirga radicis]OQD43705.1 transporter [Croceivirga radicis]